MATQAHYRGKYTRFKDLRNGSVLVRRHGDGEIAVGHPFSQPEDGFFSRLEDAWESHDITAEGTGRAAANVLNHPNLVSLHTELREWPFLPVELATTMPDRYWVWDYCDAGSLTNLLMDPPTSVSTAGFLPEGLIWHTLLGVLAGLEWLHEGMREVYVPELVVGKDGRKKIKRVRLKSRPEKAWMPILHNRICEESILFQQPRGIEKYGQVKIGDFTAVTVMGHIEHIPVTEAAEEGGTRATAAGDGRAVLVGISKEGKPLSEAVKGMGAWEESYNENDPVQAQKVVERSTRPIYRSCDIFDLGCVLYRMMTGKPIPGSWESRGEDCDKCGCNHLLFSKNRDLGWYCPHECFTTEFVDRNIEMAVEYTQALRELVTSLLEKKRNSELRASQVLETAWKGYEEWMERTQDGKLHRDLFDDIWLRMRNQERKEAEARWWEE